ncbi:MAG: enoyl-CoA hydratase/isomerase family protein [Rhodospirillaceae bacterium]|nr:enoyl-CoA hydratase/isomerase family protein [Rhodospirillaceae bacterium]MDD9925439.1 enoyl-CoA hydratase/isomerase family protein [Rhodospirillaceae bacterium]
MEIRLTEEGRHIAVITIDNQPRRNAMTREMIYELARLWDELETSDHRCIVVTGAGDRAFSSGADLGGDLRASADLAAKINRGLLKTDGYPKPILAAVNGDCVAGGLELMLSCDIRFASPNARFGLPEVKWSIYPFGGSTTKLVAQIGYVHAAEMLLGAQLISAEQAVEIDLVNRVVPQADLMSETLRFAELIAANSPSAVQAVKHQLSETQAELVRSRETVEQALGDAVRESPHFKEGVAAFLEKRQPDYD